MGFGAASRVCTAECVQQSAYSKLCTAECSAINKTVDEDTVSE